jgi:hypothetical protein
VPKPPSTLLARLVSAELEGLGVRVGFEPDGGRPPRVEDYLSLSKDAGLSAVQGVGRLLRLLRAGRLAAPADPWALASEPERAAEQLRRCRGARVRLRIARRLERMLVLWTEGGIERIDRVVDYEESGDELAIRRQGAASVLRIPRRNLVRYAASAQESIEVTGIELVS